MLSLSRSSSHLALAAALALVSTGASADGPNMPPRNPFLADSSNAMGHGTSAQQDSFLRAGPGGPSRRLAQHEIDYVHLGPLHFGANTSSPYPDGRRVLWSNGGDRIAKVDHDTFEVLATYALPGKRVYTEAHADEVTAELERRRGLSALWFAYQQTSIFDDLAGVYTLLDRDGQYFIGDSDGSISVYGDVEPRGPEAPIEHKRRYELPESVTGKMVGMNITHDGWVVVATEHGWVVAIARDFSREHTIRMRHSENAETAETGPTGKGWVRNGFAVDADGGIYVASQNHMHKVVWTGESLSIDEADGAWTERYANGGGEGTGATPSLMGFGDEDRFVVITDGDEVMNLVLFWRDDVPEGWKAPENAPSQRIAGMLPVDMGDENATSVQSEQSVVVAGYGAFVVSNAPKNAPWWLPGRAQMLLVSFLGSEPRYQPSGAQKFVWNPEARRLEVAWVNREVSSPNSMPCVSLGSNTVYTVGARDRRWTLEGLDWTTGESLFHYVVGGERYNSLFAGVLIDEEGRVHYGTTWGRLRIDPDPSRTQAP